MLYFYLRRGYLPWYARSTGAAKLESLLRETVDWLRSDPFGAK